MKTTDLSTTAICKKDAFVNGVTLLKGYEYNVRTDDGAIKVTNHFGHTTTITKQQYKELF